MSTRFVCLQGSESGRGEPVGDGVDVAAAEFDEDSADTVLTGEV